MIPYKKYCILLSLCGFIVSLDQLTKFIVINNFNLVGQSKSIITGFFNLTLVHNPGAAFGILANLDPSIRIPFFFIVPGVTLLIALYFFHTVSEKTTLAIISLSLIIGGAIGNIFDRIKFGYVIDFFDFHWKDIYHFPAFNIADSSISIGVFLLAIYILFFESKTKGKSKSLK